MNKTLLVGVNARTQIRKEQEYDDLSVLRVIVRLRPSGKRDVSYVFDKPCVADFVIRDTVTNRPILAIDQESIKSLMPKSYVIDFDSDSDKNDFYLRESRLT